MCASKSVAVTGRYTIDATETTYDQYTAWLSTEPSMAVLPTYCTQIGDASAWKTGFNPGSGGTGGYPVANVDWCDAYGYCAGIGKRLCGKIGGGSVDFNTGLADITQSQWYSACVSGTADNVYPYGKTYIKYACNDSNNGLNATGIVGSNPGCTSSVTDFTGTYSMVGNVAEWEDSCDIPMGFQGANDDCPFRGGSFSENQNDARCEMADGAPRKYTNSHVGFRCCSQ